MGRLVPEGVKRLIRTDVVRTSLIDGLAYKQKLAAGGAGLTIMTPDGKAVFTINKRDGACVPYGQVDGDVFSTAVIREAMDLTRGLPFKRTGKITKVYADKHCDETPLELETDDAKNDIDVLASVEYSEFIMQYTDKNGKFSYLLMNKELMKFASRSSVVKGMLADSFKVDAIVRYIVKSKAADLARNKGMDEDMLSAFIDTMNSMNTRSAFKELNSYLRGKMSRSRK